MHVSMLAWVRRYKLTLNMMSVLEICQGIVRTQNHSVISLKCRKCKATVLPLYDSEVRINSVQVSANLV